jgi:hypothetical protein
MIKKLLILFISFTIIFSFTACGDEEGAKQLFDELNFSLDTLSSWQGKIIYINENRGNFEDTYSNVKYDPDNPSGLLSFINCFEGAQLAEAPDEFVFSAEGMSDYIIEFYLDGAKEPELSFYYYSGSNLLTRVVRSYDEEKEIEKIDYEFYTPYGDLYSFLTAYRALAIEPESERERISLNQKQLIASVEDEELAERMTYIEDEYEVQEDAKMGEIPFEIYDGELPADEGTGCKLYDDRDIPELTGEQLVLLARIADDKGDPMKLLVTFVEFNTYYTIVTVSYPDQELMEQLDIDVDNAILLNRADISKDKRIVFVDDAGEVLYVIVPFVNG